MIVIVLFAAIFSGHGHCHNACFPDFPDSDNLGRMNETKFTTHLDYRNLLIKPTTLAPGQSIEGVIFFPVYPSDAREGSLMFAPAF